jgi:phage shock protein PspC (stress-responsive transcriptional regulator)
MDRNVPPLTLRKKIVVSIILLVFFGVIGTIIKWVITPPVSPDILLPPDE